MIKVGIAGAESECAGELMRLCLIHPDVELVTAWLPEKAGHSVSSLHPGFIGEEKIMFSSNLDATALDVVFAFRPIYTSSDWKKLMADNMNLKLILFAGTEEISSGLQESPVYGLSEMNRKPLVRGARVTVVPNTIAAVALVALYPIAAHLMLPSELKIEITAPKDLLYYDNIHAAEAEIIQRLEAVQASFTGKLECVVDGEEERERAMRIAVEIPFEAGVDEAYKIFDSIYDDHNFTYMVTHPVSTAEVEGTHKIILSLLKPQRDILRIEAVADPRMRGGASEAIHLMNLLFNLDEKTGLNLKAGRWMGGSSF